MKKYTELTDNERSTLAFHGVGFLRTISTIYGADKGQELFGKMTEFLGQDVSDSVWMVLMGGEISAACFRAYVRKPANGFVGPNKIEVIKTIHYYCALDLKRAKDIADEMFAGTPKEFVVRDVGSSENLYKLRQELHKLGGITIE